MDGSINPKRVTPKLFHTESVSALQRHVLKLSTMLRSFQCRVAPPSESFCADVDVDVNITADALTTISTTI